MAESGNEVLSNSATVTTIVHKNDIFFHIRMRNEYVVINAFHPNIVLNDKNSHTNRVS